MQKVQEVLGKATGGKAGHNLPVRKLGKHGAKITACGWGAMNLSAFYGTPEPDEVRFKVMDKAYEIGELFWDTSNVYGDNEDLIGKWFARNPGAREHIFLATKFGVTIDDTGMKIDSSPERARQALETSLQRLGVPSVDLYYIHRLDQTTPIENTMAVLQELKREGKIKHIGISECSAATLRRACKIEHVDCVQIEYSPFSLEIESEEIGLLKTCRELGVAIVAYSPIGRGMLSGKYRSRLDFDEDDFRRTAPRFSDENFPKNMELVEKIHAIAKRKGVSSSQLTLAWILAQGDDFFPIPGTTSVERLQENVDAMKITMSKDEVAEFRQACEAAQVVGDRYGGAMQAMCFADTPPLQS